MTSVEGLREFINKRLTAAAGEIFTVIEQTILQYEEEIVRQRKLLEIHRKPQSKFHGTEHPLYYDWKEEQLCNQRTNHCLQGEPEHPQIKEEDEPEPPQIEEPEKLCTSQDPETLILKYESDTLRVLSIEEQTYLSGPKEEPDIEQFLSQEPKVCDMKQQNYTESVENAELKKIFHCDSRDNFPVSEKQTECETLLCEENFSKSTCLKRNIRQKLGALTDKKKLTCEVCHKSYNRHSKMLVHMRTHTGEKPYPCETCGKGFSQRTTLLRHMKTHTGERPYSCGTCGKSFSRQSNLSVHIRTHTGEKPYSCEICGKRFCQQHHLLFHMKTHKQNKLRK